MRKNKRSFIVLGTLFGDEGKGRTVNMLVEQSLKEGRKPIVIRFNGGPQACHTVVKDNNRHVFSHFGSGTLAGAPTFWSEYCLFEPGAFIKEYNALKGYGVNPQFHISDNCEIITPWDRWVNQKYPMYKTLGTCGVGVGTTSKRIEESPYHLFLPDILGPTWAINHKMKAIHDWYINGHGGANFMYTEAAETSLHTELNMFYDYCKQFKAIIKNEYPDQNQYDLSSQEILNYFDDYIFEGSQGILLDREKGFFPNVTRSHTTSKNAREIIAKYNLPDPHTYYVSRCYLTRHGAGPMGDIIPVRLNSNAQNETNVTNQYQGEFRTSAFDLELYNYAISLDHEYGPNTRVITCMDQFNNNEYIPVKINGSKSEYTKDAFKALFPENTIFTYNP